MNRLKDDPTLAKLPAPVSLTVEQMRQVAAGTSVMLGATYARIIVSGGYPIAVPRLATVAAPMPI